MLIGSNKRFTKVAFESEAAIEKVVIENAELLFGPYILFLPQTKISTLGGAGTIPDGVVVDMEAKIWYVVEAERASHGTWEHIAPQVSKQLTALLKAGSLEKLVDLGVEQLKQNGELKNRIIDDLGMAEISIHKNISSILKKNPIVAIPIDEEPADLREWARTLKHEVKVWPITKYLDSKTGEVRYSLPEEEEGEVAVVSADSVLPSINKARSRYFQKLLKANLVNVGDTLTMHYGPHGQKKQTYSAVVRSEGLEIDGKVFAPTALQWFACRKLGKPIHPRMDGSCGATIRTS